MKHGAPKGGPPPATNDDDDEPQHEHHGGSYRAYFDAKSQKVTLTSVRSTQLAC